MNKVRIRLLLASKFEPSPYKFKYNRMSICQESRFSHRVLLNHIGVLGHACTMVNNLTVRSIYKHLGQLASYRKYTSWLVLRNNDKVISRFLFQSLTICRNNKKHKKKMWAQNICQIAIDNLTWMYIGCLLLVYEGRRHWNPWIHIAVYW